MYRMAKLLAAIKTGKHVEIKAVPTYPGILLSYELAMAERRAAREADRKAHKAKREKIMAGYR